MMNWGSDASAFLNAVTGYSQPQQYRLIDAAPDQPPQATADVDQRRNTAQETRWPRADRRQTELTGRSSLD